MKRLIGVLSVCMSVTMGLGSESTAGRWQENEKNTAAGVSGRIAEVIYDSQENILGYQVQFLDGKRGVIDREIEI